jgi:hypothetical protein
VTKFLACAQPLINLAITITKNHEWTRQEAWEGGDLVENLTLNLAPFAFDIIPINATSLAFEGFNNLAINATNHLSNVLQTKINAKPSGRKKKNVNWVVSLSPEASTHNFAKAQVDIKD